MYGSKFTPLSVRPHEEQMTWLGAEYVAGTFRWEDGTPWDYSNWGTGRFLLVP